MPGKFIQAAGNELIDLVLYLPAVPYPTIAAAGPITNTTVTIPGVIPLDCVSWSIQNVPAHLALENIWVSAANTAIFTWSSDGVGIGSGTVPVLLEIVRVDGSNLGLSVFPTQILT